MIRILMMMLKFSGWGGYHLRRTWLRWSTSHDVGKVSRNIFIFPDKDCWFPIGDSRLAETVSVVFTFLFLLLTKPCLQLAMMQSSINPRTHVAVVILFTEKALTTRLTLRR